jgi:1-acyl-sn-glycerol-3-phosphate acyltransferase
VLYCLVWGLCSTLLRVVFGFRTYGRRNVPKSGGVILAINHASYLDPVIVGCGMTRAVNFMARDSLFVGPFGWLIGALNAFPVTRGGSDVKALKEYIARVSSGRVVMLFPEGTRTRDGLLQPLMSGVGMIAARAGVPVVPTYVAGSFRAWPRHRLLPSRADVAIYYDAPVSVEKEPGEGKRQHQERIRGIIESRLKRLEACCASSSVLHGGVQREGPAAAVGRG